MNESFVKEEKCYLAFDFGASSGRLMEFEYKDGVLSFIEINRIAHDILKKDGHYLWDLDKIKNFIFESLKKADLRNRKYKSIGIDTWGVDYVLIDDNGNLVSPCYSYRDIRTKDIYFKIEKFITKEELYKITGSQSLEINTLCQLTSEDHNILKKASHLLMMPDYFAYILSGVISNEPTQASTSQLFDITLKKWSESIINKLDLPYHIFSNLIAPTSVLSDSILINGVKPKGALSECKLIQVATHDTASAVVSITFEDEKNGMFISSGTWSVMGAVLDSPILNSLAKELNFANELAFDGKIRFLKSLPGLWLVQEVRHSLKNSSSFQELEDEAMVSKPFRSIIPTKYSEFSTLGNMVLKIQKLCKDTNQPIPTTNGEIIRCVYDSLALSYKQCASEIEKVSGKKYNSINIIGGGAKSATLNQLCADVLKIKVIAGPFEATAIGNAIVQLISDGICKNLKEASQIVKKSFAVTTYTVKNNNNVKDAYKLYEELSKEYK